MGLHYYENLNTNYNVIYKWPSFLLQRKRKERQSKIKKAEVNS